MAEYVLNEDDYVKSRPRSGDGDSYFSRDTAGNDENACTVEQIQVEESSLVGLRTTLSTPAHCFAMELPLLSSSPFTVSFDRRRDMVFQMRYRSPEETVTMSVCAAHEDNPCANILVRSSAVTAPPCVRRCPCEYE